jgi:hypothetical protein
VGELVLAIQPGVPHSITRVLEAVTIRRPVSPSEILRRATGPEVGFEEIEISLILFSSKQPTELRSDRNGRNLRWAMMCVLEAAASYGPKWALVLDEPVSKHGSEVADRLVMTSAE